MLVKAGWNHWFQVSEAEAAIAAIQAITRRFRRVVTYGSSMGGYAAALWSGALAADAIIAVSPQFSIDRLTSPREKRWAEDARRITFSRDDMAAGLNPAAQLNLLYDPFTPDRDHAERLLALSSNPRPLLIPFGGHPAGAFLRDAGCLSRIILGLVRGSLGPAEARSIVRQSRRSTAVYWANSAALLTKNRRSLALAAIGQAQALQSSNPGVHYQLGKILSRLGQFTEAARAFEQAVAGKPLVAPYHLEWGLSLLRIAQPDAAVRVLTTATSLDPRQVRAHAALAAAYLATEAIGPAREALDRAATMNPQDPVVVKLRRQIAGRPAEVLLAGP
ncbi:MAG: tetratricopeptide repeat protein [Acetobacteraceae bacterium]|nr:MAG: tetratricopeptide repeat protein [Acetobacteraceae bacterium]